MKHLLKAITYCSALVAVALFSAPAASAQCPAPTCQFTAGPADEHWPENTRVNVFIDDAFTPDQQGRIAEAFNRWAPVAAEQGIYYTLNFGIPTSLPTNYHTVERAVPQTMIGASEETGGRSAMGLRSGLPYDFAVTRIDPHVTDLQALGAVMAHGIGHTMGLGDCPNCCPGSTVMRGNRPDPQEPWHADYNNSEGMADGPTACDAKNSKDRFDMDEPDLVDDTPPPSGGGDDNSLTPATDGPTCYQEIVWNCNTDYSGCYVVSTRFLGCW